MKNLLPLAAALTLGAAALAGAHAMAATNTSAAPPMCASSTAQMGIQNGSDAQALSAGGKTVDSLEIWNGCLKAVTTDAHGHTTTAFYDPDTLNLISTMKAGSSWFG